MEMMNDKTINIITSLQNPRIKNIVSLRNRRDREEQSLMIVEDIRCIDRALINGVKFTELYHCPELYKEFQAGALVKKIAKSGAKLFEVDDKVFCKIAYKDNPEGLLGICSYKNLDLENLPLVKDGLYVIVETLEKVGNLGNILRTSDAAGIDGLIICEKKTDIYNPNVIRSSTGAVFSVPIAEATREEVINWLKKASIKILASTPQTDKIYSNVNMTGAIAIALGSEAEGLSKEFLKEADELIKIPMKGTADSLNVASTAAILLFEATRQRGFK